MSPPAGRPEVLPVRSWFRRVLPILLLVAAVAPIVWHSRRGATRTIVPVDVPRETQVDAPWFAMASGGPTSGVSEVTIRLAAPEGSGAQVGFYETEAQGTGDTWRATAWMATVVASLTAGIDLGQYVPSFTVEGRIDGPSAGGLLTVALIATLRDHKLPPQATMTGTIGPDGTIGPVAGVVHKLEAARRSGKDLLLIPAGQRDAINHYTQQPVDVVAYGQAIGVEVREVGDLAEAYHALTGHRLSRAGAGDQEPDLPADVRTFLDRRTNDWLQASVDHIKECDRLRLRWSGPLGFAQEVEEARTMLDRARRFSEAGQVAAGYEEAITAALQAAVLDEVLRGVDAVADGGMKAIGSRLESVGASEAGIAQALAGIGAVGPASPDALMAAADAYGVVAQAVGLRMASERMSQELEAEGGDDSALEYLFKAGVILALDANILQIAEDRLGLAPRKRSRATVHADRVSAWAHTLERAAGASIAYFDAICLADSARQLSLHPDVLRDSMACQDLGYLLARSSLDALPSLQEELDNQGRADVATLGASIGAYATASALVAKFHSLRVQMDQQGNIVGVEDEAGLDRMLDLAARNARGAITEARKHGARGTVPIFYYAVGQSQAEGDTLGQLEALQYFWQASLSARLMTLVCQRRGF
jgi:uncharacterized protein